MRETVPSPESATHTDPPAARTADGSAPTSIRSVVPPRARSNLVTDPEPRLAIQPTRSVSTATATGSTPVAIRRTVSLLSAFTIVTVSSRLFATKRRGTSPATYVTAVGPLPTSIRWAPRVVPRRTRSTQWLPESVSHAYPPPTATPAPIEPIPDAALGVGDRVRAAARVEPRPAACDAPDDDVSAGRGEARRIRHRRNLGRAARRRVQGDDGIAQQARRGGGRRGAPAGHEDGQQRDACDPACRRQGCQPATASCAGRAAAPRRRRVSARSARRGRARTRPRIVMDRAGL